jgi:hypothetical protein
MQGNILMIKKGFKNMVKQTLAIGPALVTMGSLSITPKANRCKYTSGGCTMVPLSCLAG